MDETSTVRSELITGCSSGIGLCLAYGLRSKGYRVFVSARIQSAEEPLSSHLSHKIIRILR